MYRRTVVDLCPIANLVLSASRLVTCVVLGAALRLHLAVVHLLREDLHEIKKPVNFFAAFLSL